MTIWKFRINAGIRHATTTPSPRFDRKFLSWYLNEFSVLVTLLSLPYQVLGKRPFLLFTILSELHATSLFKHTLHKITTTEFSTILKNPVDVNCSSHWYSSPSTTAYSDQMLVNIKASIRSTTFADTSSSSTYHQLEDTSRPVLPLHDAGQFRSRWLG